MRTHLPWAWRTGYGRETLADLNEWPCEPEIIADDLLDAVRQILKNGVTST